jgi:regulator of protease activity HflC (stomatin/prohibitin superfamily)
MDESVGPQGEQRVRGYGRTTVDDFLIAADAERRRLERVIADSRAREQEARAAISAHQVMLTMLLDTYHDLDERRRQAEKEAAALLEAADRDAREILIEARGSRYGSIEWSGLPPQTEVEREGTNVIDLSQAEAVDGVPPAVAGSPVFAAAARANGHDEQASSGYFDFLRGALDDDQPLGPRAE